MIITVYGGENMYYKDKKVEVSAIKQVEDKNHRFDYGKVTMDLTSGIRGESNNIKDFR